MRRLRYALALALAYAAGYAMRRPEPAPCPDEDDVPADVARDAGFLRELQRRSYRAGEADGRAASLGAALRLAGERPRYRDPLAAKRIVDVEDYGPVPCRVCGLTGWRHGADSGHAYDPGADAPQRP